MKSQPDRRPAPRANDAPPAPLSLSAGLDRPEDYALDSFAAGVSAPTPYLVETALAWLRDWPLIAAEGWRARQALQDLVQALAAELDDTTDELSDAFSKLERLLKKPRYSADIRAIIAVATINDGHVVRDLHAALQTVIFDLRESFMSTGSDKYKGKVKLALTVTPDKTSDTPAVNIEAEVRAEVPPAASDGKCYLDDENEIAPPEEAIRQLPLLAVRALDETPHRRN